ncbi:hypothetical protein [Caballeronia sp. GAWG1-1]|uniref:hypothetical protein n=1 Tax=Caballeronia sp. GAWG1-1 TaxID=2921742 RepID=UPI002028CB08|nr:hypothetical protein [Caballeronia sp. GAWG1-1]
MEWGTLYQSFQLATRRFSDERRAVRTIPQSWLFERFISTPTTVFDWLAVKRILSGKAQIAEKNEQEHTNISVARAA